MSLDLASNSFKFDKQWNWLCHYIDYCFKQGLLLSEQYSSIYTVAICFEGTMVAWLWGKHWLRSPQTGLINVIIIINCSSNSLNVTFASLRKCLQLVEILSKFAEAYKFLLNATDVQPQFDLHVYNDNILEMTLNTSPLLLLHVLFNIIWSYCWQ